MSEVLATIQFWHWWILGLGLVIIELIVPGFFLLWIGIAAGLTGVLALVVPTTPWEVQFLVFGVLTVAAVVAARFYFRRYPIETKDSTLNRRGAQYVGRVLSVEEAIVNGRGKVRVDDTVWRAEGPDVPAGGRVKVTGVAGTVLQVEKAEG
jgi:membrane protein implicated in regulation of membrane protease activity